MRVIVTAGFDRARHAIALCELVHRDGHEIAAVLIARPLRWRRVAELARRRGLAGLRVAARRFAGSYRASGVDAALEALLRELGVRERSLAAWTRAHGAALHAVDALDGDRAVAIVRALAPDGVLYAGGGILRPAFIDAARGRVLNAHAGPLPDVRGMNACEWAVALGLEPCVTIHVIDAGVDTGGAIERVAVALERDDDLEALRGKCAVAGVRGLARAVSALAAPLPSRARDAERARQCFSMAPAVRELAERALARRLAPGGTRA